MTLDEAITHAREVAERNKRAMNFESVDNVDDDIKMNCLNCAEQHEQLAEWLEELKRRRYDGELTGSGLLNNAYKNGYNKAINDFVTKYKLCDNRSIQCHKALNCADCIADQLKVGCANDR